MPNPLEFFKNIFSTAGKVAAETGEAVLKGGVQVTRLPSVSLPDLSGVGSTIASGAQALGTVAESSLKNYKAPNAIDSSGLNEAYQSSVDLQQKILKDRISETKIKNNNEQPINMLSSIDAPKVKVKEAVGENFAAKKSQEKLSPAKALYGPREKNSKRN